MCLFVCICDIQIGHLKKGINPLSVSELAFGSPYLSSAIKTGIITGIIGLAVSIKQYNSLHMHQMLIAWHLAPLLINEILIFIIHALLTCTRWNFVLMRDYFKTNLDYIQNFIVLNPTQYKHLFSFYCVSKLYRFNILEPSFTLLQLVLYSYLFSEYWKQDKSIHGNYQWRDPLHDHRLMLFISASTLDHLAHESPTKDCTSTCLSFRQYKNKTIQIKSLACFV